MKKLYLGLVLATVMSATSAFAQAAAPAPAPAAPPAAGAATPAVPGALTLVAADATKLKDWITAQKTASTPAPAGFTVAVGAAVPAAIMLYPVAAAAGVTAAGTNQYAVIGDKTVLVNPTDRKIVYIFS